MLGFAVLQQLEARCFGKHYYKEMDDPFEGTEVTVVSEEMEESYVPAKPPVKKKKYRGCSEQGETAKKPRSAYLLYYYDIYLKVQQEVPHLPQSEINKKISESWKLLSVAEKSYYLERAKLEKEGLDSNIKSSRSTMISDVPGFRKILPRSEYILIPKRIPEEERQRVDICVTQPREAAVLAPSAALSHNGGQSIITLDPGQMNLSEHLTEVEGLTEEGASFTTASTLQEVVPGGIYTQLPEKLTGEIILNDATLEIGQTSTYPGANVVIEEDGGIALAQSEMSVLTVMAIQETDEHCPAPPASQYIMMPMASRPLTEPSRTIKLATTYTRRGHGSCTNPSCTFTYVTRHKPPKCPLCNQLLGGKWVPKGKQTKEKHPISSNPSDSPDATEQSVITANESKATEKENTEAVSHLLQAAPAAQGEEWEEVIISDSHFITEDNGEAQGSTQVNAPQENSGQVAELDANKTEKPPSAGRFKASSSKTPSSSASSANKAETKSTAKPLAAASRPIRAILPAPANANRGPRVECTGSTLTILKPDTHSLLSSTGLKASTLKQLGQVVLQQPGTPDITVRADLQAPVSQPQLKVMTDSFPTYKYSCPVALDLGLATQRGKGKCKNPFCNFMYTNRHKPKTCPNCGFSLTKDKVEKEVINETPVCITTDLSVRESLTQAQKEIQRQSTLQLIRKIVQIPENESELSDTFNLIQELNSSHLILSDVSDGTVTIEQTSWANVYESPSDRCLLCGTQLFKGDKNSVAGAQDCWLLTSTRLHLVSAQVKVCLNPQCLALHSFNDIFTGLFNVGNKLLVSLDLLFSIRNQIRVGEDPKMSISNILDSVQRQAEKVLSAEELLTVQELLSCGYWAFECLTVRDYNDMICGVCGVAPKVEIAQRNVEDTLTLTNIEFTWPEFLTTNEVSMEDFWSTLENEVLEQAAFPSSIPITKFDASIISPFFPPLMRGAVVVNSESYKNLEIQKVVGNGSALARLLHDGTLKLDDLNKLSTEELQKVLTLCGIPWEATDTKDNMCYSILALSEFVQNGTQTKQPPAHFTGGKLYKVCAHQVVCGSKYIVRGESPRDHVDLLASSRHWPPVYVVDMATQVALCADLCYPDLAHQMWGKNQGCFSDPSEPPKYVSCPELLDRHYSVDIMGNEPSIVHPVTKSESRRIVHAVAEQNGACDPTARHHSLSLCREMEPYSAIITAIGDSKTSNIRHHPINFDNATHYYLYNRLIDFLTSREIVNRQIHDIVQSCQPGEVVIRDTLYRLGVAQIKTELGDSVLEEDVLLDQPSSV
ncbi:HMG domain-containing protein 3 isoform X2 [Hyla sarda]|uniref:HMG domain-containing protein 3 isoform X2 n=1 Tax=Hyla sarda TaxID=327740 RepID=UPI0024C2F403|nr:HMG domain-containing protein 3 isoform X2 [Hyla sarda]